MLVRAVAGIDDAGLEPLGEEFRRAGGAVPEHDDVGMQRFEIFGGVLERFAFRQAGSGGGNIDHVRAQAKCREFERSARARARLDEKIDQRFSAQGRHFLDLARAHLLKRVGCLENEIDFLGRQLA